MQQHQTDHVNKTFSCVRNTIGVVSSNIRYAGYSAGQSGWSYLAESERSVRVRQKVQQNQTNLLLVIVAS